MEKLIEIYNEVFPHTRMADWFYAFLGLMIHVAVKLKNVHWQEFKLKRFLGEFLPVWFFAIITIVICLGALPQLMSNYNVLDSALIGYGSSSMFKQMFKSRKGNLNVFV